MKGPIPKENRNLRTPAAFLPYQQAWAADEAPVKVYEKSRRIGISWAEAGEDALLAASEKGMDVWYIGYNRDMALEFVEDAADWARHYSLAASSVEEFVFEDGEERKGIAAFRLRFDSGFKIVALSSRPANLRGKQGKIVIDEAAFHDDLPGLLKAAIAMLMWGGRVVVISTHDGDDNPFNELINDIRAGKKPYSLHRTTLDDALEQGLYRRICLRLGKPYSEEDERAWRQELIDFYGDDADEELFCIPAQGSGTYMSRVLIEACLDPEIPILRYEQPQGFAERPEHIRRAETQDWLEEVVSPVLDELDIWPSYVGEDFGRLADMTAIVPLQQRPDTVLRAPFICELWNIPFRQQEQILFYICDRLPWFSGAALDARGNGQYLAEVAMQKYGSYRVEQVMLSDAWYRENMPRYKACFEDRTILLPRHSDIIDDNRAIKKVRGVPKVPDVRKEGQNRKKRHGDTAIAAALAVYAAYQFEASGSIGYESVIKRRLGSQRGAY